MSNEYAPEGFRFYSVSTPSVFHEVLAPAEAEIRTAAQRREMAKLEDLAERHGTHIHSSEYRRG